MSDGFLYYLAAQGRKGKKHAIQLAVSVYNLRQYAWTGPVHIVAGDDDALRVARSIAEDQRFPDAGKVTVQYEDRAGVKCYGLKTKAQQWSPYERTVFIDADTVPVGSLNELLPEEDEIVLTQFADWRALGRLISSRIAKWHQWFPEWTNHALEQELPALNTGIFGFSKRTTFFQPWMQMCSTCPDMFLGDETACQVLVAHRSDCRLLDDRWNRSIKHGIASEDIRMWHFHGGKAFSYPPGQELWRQKFDEACGANFAGLRDWAPDFGPELVGTQNE